MWDDPLFHANISNPWHDAHIDFEDQDVVRDVNMEQLSKKGPKGYDTWSWKQYLYALEQENYCDFEVGLLAMVCTCLCFRFTTSSLCVLFMFAT